MEFIGTKFSITFGAWRLRFVLSLEEANDELRPQPQRVHHMSAPRDRFAVR